MKKQYSIGASDMACEFVIPKILPELIKRLPGIEFRIDVRDSLRIYDKVLRGGFELGVIGLKKDSDYVEFTPLIKGDRLCVIAPVGHPLALMKEVTVNDLKAHEFVGFSLGTGTRVAYERVFLDAGLSLDDLNVVVEMDDTRGVIQAVEIGTGIAVVSALAADNWIKLGKIVCINIPIKITRDFYLIRLKNRTLSPEAQDIVRITRDILHP